MIKIKDIVEFILFGFGMVALILLAGILESSPLGISVWIAVVLGALLWILWLVLTLKDNKAANAPLVTEPLLWVSDGEKWVAMDGSGRTKPFQSRAERREQLFDLADFDEDVIFNQKVQP